MRKVTTAVTQMACSWDREKTLYRAEHLVREAVEKGANIVLLQELFETPYFCQTHKFKYFNLAKTVEENSAVQHFKALAKKLGVVIPVSFYEKSGNTAFNSVAVIDATGEILGIYRKTHIPDGMPYAEKFYFTPGDTGFKVWDTAYGKIGVGICWDQWFPEAARAMALLGAEMLFYPAAREAYDFLSQSTDAKGRKLKVHKLCCPAVPITIGKDFVIDITRDAKERLEGDICIASYANFLIVNGGVIVPQYGDVNDKLALEQIWEMFPERKVVGVYTREIVYGGGNIHCITQQLPER